MRKVLFALLLLLSSCVQEFFLDNKEGMKYLLITKLMREWYVPKHKEQYCLYLLGYWAQIVHTRHGRISDFILNLLAGMATFALYDTKPSIIMKFEMEEEAEVKQLTLF